MTFCPDKTEVFFSFLKNPVSVSSIFCEINLPFMENPLTIRWYGVIIAFGLTLAVLFGGRKAYVWKMDINKMLDVLIYGAVGGILGARLYYVFSKWDYYSVHLDEIFQIWNGGLAIYGGVLGAVVGLAVFCKIKKIKLPMLLDLVSLGFLIGQSMGRWGNFFNREAFGAETTSFLRMGLMNAYTGEVTYYHPTFFYESVWNAVGFVLLHKLSKKRQYDGQIALGYAAWYGLGRAFIEGLRTDSLYLGPFRVSQLLAAISCIAALSVLIWQMRKPHDPAGLYVNKIAEKESNEE